jgi:hypothetical protein
MGIFGSTVDKDMLKEGLQVQINSLGKGDQWPGDIAAAGTAGFAVASLSAGGPADVCPGSGGDWVAVRFLNDEATPASPEWRLCGLPKHPPAVGAFPDDRVVVVRGAFGQVPNTLHGLEARLLIPTEPALPSPIDVDACPETKHVGPMDVATFGDGSFIVVWASQCAKPDCADGILSARRFGPAGQPLYH